MIFSRDHWPPHVHVVGPNVRAKVSIEASEVFPRILTNVGLSASQMKDVLLAIDDNWARLQLRWREIHGDS
jgi:hypothetical protein